MNTSILSVRERTDIRNVDTLMGKAYDLLNKKGIVNLGAPYAIYHSPFFDPGETDLEVGFPVSPAGYYSKVLAGCTCAMCVHKGDYSSINNTFKQMVEWIEQKGYTITGMPYERYLNNPREVPTEELLTEVYFPVEKI